MAYLASLITNIVNSLYGSKSKTKPTTPLDFMPDWNIEAKKPKKKSVEDLKKILMGMVSANNAKYKNSKPPVNNRK